MGIRMLLRIDLRVWVYLKIMKDTMKFEGFVDKGYLRCPGIPIQDIPDDLSIEYGFQEIASKWGDEPWKFRFHDSYHNSQGEGIKIQLNSKSYFIGLRKHLSLHSPFFAWLPTDQKYLSIECDDICKLMICFQIAHGVQFSLQESTIRDTLGPAKQFQLANVTRFCERQLIEADDSSNMKENIRLACEYNLRHFYIHLIRKVKDAKSLGDIIDEESLNMMPGEILKATVAMFFHRKL
uniref:BTB domain-containing protein n=1 Tax=Caenorhabditis tropicalis TaxID=1561998 RepID=A0A1I7UE19_9PELO